MFRLGRKRKSQEVRFGHLSGQPPSKRSRLDEMVRLGRRRKYTQELDDLNGQPPHKRQKVDDEEMEVDPLTKFLWTIRAWVDINKIMAIWCR